MNNLNALAHTGDSPILPIVIGIVVVALIALLIAFLGMMRKRK